MQLATILNATLPTNVNHRIGEAITMTHPPLWAGGFWETICKRLDNSACSQNGTRRLHVPGQIQVDVQSNSHKHAQYSVQNQSTSMKWAHESRNHYASSQATVNDTIARTTAQHGGKHKTPVLTHLPLKCYHHCNRHPPKTTHWTRKRPRPETQAQPSNDKLSPKMSRSRRRDQKKTHAST